MSFLQKYELLKQSIPVPALLQREYVENCEFSDYIYQSKNCYYCFDSYKLQDSMYCISGWGNNLVDCDYSIECELCYECLQSFRCYSSTYLLECNNCRDCHFCAFCLICSDCFGCVGLTHKQYCIFNKQYTKEEYLEKIKELKKESPQKILQAMLKLKKTIPHRASQQYNTKNCPYGDYIYDSKNSYWCFHAFWLQDCGFCFDSGLVRDSFDTFTTGSTKAITELCYQLVECTFNYDSAYLFGCDYCTNCYYSSYLVNCTDCFGCAGLTNKKYCILNKQLSKEQYYKEVAGVKKELGWKI